MRSEQFQLFHLYWFDLDTDLRPRQGISPTKTLPVRAVRERRDHARGPAGKADCADAVWGYGEASWRADFLAPASPLLAAAPWVMVRGNHDECARGRGLVAAVRSARA